MQYIVFGKPLINSKQKKEVLHTLNSGWIGSGPKVQILEGEAFLEAIPLMANNG